MKTLSSSPRIKLFTLAGLHGYVDLIGGLLPGILPALLQPGGLLMRESPHALLDACQELPVARRNLLLPHLHRTVDYEL